MAGLLDEVCMFHPDIVSGALNALGMMDLH